MRAGGERLLYGVVQRLKGKQEEIKQDDRIEPAAGARGRAGE